jgi:transcriptional regulator with XRE-family HTH domain
MARERITSVADLGLVLRAVRRAHRLRLDDLAGCAKVGHVFAREVEHGKETVQLGRVLRLLAELGVHLEVDMPEVAREELARLRATGLKPLTPRKRTPSRP